MADRFSVSPFTVSAEGQMPDLASLRAAVNNLAVSTSSQLNKAISGDSAGLPQFILGQGDSLVASKATALQRFYYCLANAASAPCDMVFLGDSITTGFQVTVAQRWQTILRTLMRAKFQPAGVTGGRGYFSAIQAVGTPVDYPSVVTGGSLSWIDGPGAKSCVINSGNKIVYTTGNVTSVKIFYFANGLTGSWSYKVDGGTATVIPGGTTPGAMASVNITGLGGTSHTIEVDYVSGVASFINGFLEMNGDEAAGLRFWDAGQSSITLANMLTSNGMLNDFQVIQPALVTVMIGVNDWGTQPTGSPNPLQRNSQQFAADLNTLITGIYANTTTKPTIVLMPEWNVNPQGGVTPIDTWANFVQVMYNYAANDPNVCVFDIRSRINTGQAGFAGGLLVDTTHPSAQGSIIVANALTSFLSP